MIEDIVLLTNVFNDKEKVSKHGSKLKHANIHTFFMYISRFLSFSLFINEVI